MRITATMIITTVIVWILAFIVVELFKYAVWERLFPRNECNCKNHE